VGEAKIEHMPYPEGRRLKVDVTNTRELRLAERSTCAMRKRSLGLLLYASHLWLGRRLEARRLPISRRKSH